MSKKRAITTSTMSAFGPFGGGPTFAFSSSIDTNDIKKQILLNELDHLVAMTNLVTARVKQIREFAADPTKFTEAEVRTKIEEINLLLVAISKIKLT